MRGVCCVVSYYVLYVRDICVWCVCLCVCLWLGLRFMYVMCVCGAFVCVECVGFFRVLCVFGLFCEL